jgi:tellurite resistance protein
VVPALAGTSLGYPEWAAAQFGIGVLFWPVVIVLLVVRIGVHGIWSERLLPSTFITVAPPSVIGLGALQFGAAPALVWMCWGTGLFFVVWATSVFKRMVSQPFAITFWGLSFPLAAFAGLTLAVPASGAFAVVAMVVLALTTLVVAWLTLSTVKGLRDGSLLMPEPVATLHPAAS